MTIWASAFPQSSRCGVASCLGLMLVPFVAGCANVPLQEAGTLSTYKQLQQSNGLLTKAKVRVDKDAILAAKTAHIVPASFAPAARRAPLSQVERDLVSNAVNRALCIGLSDRFRIVSPPERADLTIYVGIATIVPTHKVAAAASKAVSIGTSVATNTGLVDTSVPIPSVRIPIGLGGIALEAEAVDTAGNQKAAMMWARGANSFLGATRVSSVGDAYELAAAFGDDFSALLVKGANPFGAKLPSLPSLPARHRLKSMFGGAPKESACEAFGRVGVTNILGSSMGFPPEWTDKGGAQTAPQTR